MVKAAVVYIPPDLRDDVRFASYGLAYIVRCQYGYAGHFRDPDLIDYLLTNGLATVVILASRSHLVPGRKWPIEFINSTRTIPPPIPLTARHRNGRIWVSQRAVAPDSDPGHAARHRDVTDEVSTVAILAIRRKSRAERILDDATGRWASAGESWRRRMKPPR